MDKQPYDTSMLSKEHDFKYGCNDSGSYAQVVYCAKCGHVSWNGNTTGQKRIEAQRLAREPCPFPTLVQKLKVVNLTGGESE